MKKQFLSLASILRMALLCLLMGVAGMPLVYSADFDFSAVCSTGQTLYYRIINSTTHEVQLTYPNYQKTVSEWNNISFVHWSHWTNYDKPVGDIVVPDVVVHDGVSYTVTSIRDHTFGTHSESPSNNMGNLRIYYTSPCEDITSIVIPSSVISIGNDVFGRCSGLTSVTLPDSISAIEDYSFYKCSSLSTIEIPNTVTVIGNSAFLGCSGLLSIVSFNETPPIVGSCAFDNVDKSTPVHIPSGSLAAYQGADGWSEFLYYYYIGFTQYAIVATVNPIEGGALSGTGNYSINSPCTLTATANSGYTFVNWTENGEVVSTNATYTFTVTGNRTLVANFAVQGESNIPEGAIPGMFSINDSIQVYFSQGNLQYQASTNTWRFAENQWDFVGNNTYGTVYENGVKCNNSLISSTYDGWIDLFGWGTSGWNSGATCYQPWSTSTVSKNYHPGGNSNNSLTGDYSNADWGIYNPIENGGNQNGLWRTLTSSEFQYIFNTRNTESGIRFAKAKVNNINGAILLPDNWSDSYYSLNNTNQVNASFSNNTITASQWTTLEQHGAVFLPAGGYREGTSISGIETGDYWAASSYSSSFSYGVQINNSLCSVDNNNYLYNGRTVRLACMAYAHISYSIDVMLNPVEGGAINGTGTYENGQTCTLTATANSGYTFVNWTENGVIVSTNATYSFTVTGNRTLVANFAAQGEFNIPEGAIAGVFSVGENTQVFFSQGNLQYIGSAETPYWKFADSQWDYLGTTTNQNSSNSNVDRDLFGWGASGYNHGATAYQPWSTSTTNSHYYVYGSSSYNLFEQTGQADWGNNAIVNGGNQENSGWRTLAQLEWDYVINTRNTSSSIRYAKANVNNINGVILLPDDWSSSYYSLNSTNNSGVAFSTNVIDAIQWQVLEQHGAVFLSAAGYRSGSSVSGVGTSGNYWSVSCSDSNNAYSVNFHGGGLRASFSDDRYYGQSVRLVRPVQNNFYGINASPNPTEGGEVSGGGAYQEGDECTLTATANEGYTFSCWTENGEIVSTEVTYSFIVTGDRMLVANFVADSGGTVPEGALNGIFSVGEGTQVYFSQGNLQYIGSAETPYWKFADNQWDYFGTTTNQNSSNSNVDRDLFGWGTSGYNHGAVCYQPWATSTSYSDYYAYGNSSYNLFDQTGKADWGYNAISNGGNQENSGWRTLTYEEWKYLFNTRTTNSGIRYAKAEVNGVNGVVLLPDNWSVSYYSLNSSDNTDVAFSTNVIDDAQWLILEQHGAVFLPVAGRRIGTPVDNIGSIGGYWSASYGNSGYVYNVCFTGSSLLASGSYRYFGHSVRLVSPALTVYYGINASPSSAEGGEVSGGGAYQAGAVCTLTATANEGYTFSCWTENGEIVSTEVTYSFIVTGDRMLVANFVADSGGTVPEGALNGVFSVGDGTQVYFSQGNLQYIGSAETPYWKFADDQWDYFGATTGQGSDSQTVDRDLFGWGTSGYNHGANAYRPWSTSSTNSDYYAYGSQTYNLNDQTGQADWGFNPISNGGNEENSGWRTLTYEEWDYLFNIRTTNLGIRYAKAQVNGVNGVVLLPDSWSASYYSLNSTNNPDVDFVCNVIDVSQWLILEQHGAVFLPAAGGRSGTSVDFDTYGNYWSVSFSNYDNAYGVYFDESYLDASDNVSRYNGRSVRLVRPAQIVSFSINATSSPAEGGEVSGGGAYQVGTDCTLTATANEGYTFSCWTENGQVVSEDEIYTFVVTGARNLVANFIITSPEPASVVITLNPGWNWISYLLETETTIENALVNLTPCDGDMLKAQDCFATYKAALGQWSGSLRTMIPGQGYIYLRNGEQTTFTYPKE